MLKNERKINYRVGLDGKLNDLHKSWTGIEMNFWPLIHPCTYPTETFKVLPGHKEADFWYVNLYGLEEIWKRKRRVINPPEDEEDCGKKKLPNLGKLSPSSQSKLIVCFIYAVLLSISYDFSLNNFFRKVHIKYLFRGFYILYRFLWWVLQS